MSLKPTAGDGALARADELVLLCGPGEYTAAALAAHRDTAAAGGDANALAGAIEQAVGQNVFAGVVFGPAPAGMPGTAVAVFGHAWADVTTEYGEQRLALTQDIGGVRSVLPGKLVSIRAGLGNAGANDAQPAAWAELRDGVVPASGLLYQPDDAPAPARPSPQPVAAAPAAAPAPAPVQQPAAPTRDEDTGPLAPLGGPPSDPTLAPPPEPATPIDLGKLPTPVAAETIAPAAAPPAPAQQPPPPTPVTSDIDRSVPFESVSLFPAAAPAVAERAPLPVVDAPLPPPAPNVAPAPHPTPDEGVQVLGVYCKNGHFDDPAARYCAVCGISMAQLTLIPRPGPRPPLGVLVLDDGSIFSLDADYVVGRNPDRFELVANGTARALRVEDRDGLLSRAHAQIRLDEWQVTVVDLNSVNGTGILSPGEQAWRRLPPSVPVTIKPGTEIGFGQRRVRYESHRNT